MRVEPEIFRLGNIIREVICHRLVFTTYERGILEEAARIAEKARALVVVDSDEDILLAEIEHGCRDLIEPFLGTGKIVIPWSEVLLQCCLVDART